MLHKFVKDSKVTDKKIISAKLSKLINLYINQVNIKATTTEKMGPLGNKEGLGAFALVNII